jgi:hypothetical protein
MKLEVGMYVRLVNDVENIVVINKIANVFESSILTENDGSIYQGVYTKENVIKASYNITDLIKSKDIILGRDGKIYQCWKIYKDYVFTYSKNKQGQTVTLVDYQIDKVLTKEQFEQMSYKVGDK